jgi:hypothetical protein
VIRSPSDPDQTKTRRERGASRRQITSEMEPSKISYYR